jgi:transcriptional regulator of nitric oxide reductase
MTSIPDDFPWLAAAARVYGPLADAFGLRPVRDALQTWSELASAQLGETVANAQVLGVVTAGAFDGMSRLTQRLDRLRSEGETISSPTALLRAGLGEFDGAMHAAMLSEPGLAATAASVRATSRRRSAWQKLSGLGAEAMGQATRAEVDEAFREIQQLKRELRQLKRAARAGATGSQA